MRIFSKILIIIAIIGLVLVLTGGGLFLVALAKADWDIKKLSTVEYELHQFNEQTENFTNIGLDLDNGNVEITLSDTQQNIGVEYYTKKNKRGKTLTEMNVEKSGNTLKFIEKSKWYSIFTFGFEVQTPTTKIVLPADREYSLNFDLDNGSVKFVGGELKTSAFSIDVDNGTCNISNGGVNCTGNFNVNIDNGSVNVKAGVTASVIYLETDNGSVIVDGAEVSANKITLDTDNGNITTKNNGKIYSNDATLKVDNGGITATFAGVKSDYSITSKVGNGSTNVYSQSGGNKKLYLKVDNGNIRCYFADEE